MRREAVGVVEWFIEAQRQHRAVDEKYAAEQREEEEAEEVAIRRRGS